MEIDDRVHDILQSIKILQICSMKTALLDSNRMPIYSHLHINNKGSCMRFIRYRLSGLGNSLLHLLVVINVKRFSQTGKSIGRNSKRRWDDYQSNFDILILRTQYASGSKLSF
uniref:Uncharacterized protein n=1 Tax=Glossina pallidipes TaxID=7398 RepID=A0A1B0A9M5_GLOPL